MKKILLSVFGFLVAFTPFLVKGQTATFTMQYTSDTVYALYNGVPIHDDINPVSGTIYIKWHVIASDFPADWRADSVLGICDAGLCRANTSGSLWNGTPPGNSYIAQYPDPFSGAKTFDLNLTMGYPSLAPGTHYITVKLLDTVSTYSKNITFIVTRAPLGISNITNSETDVQLYPNPARDEVNLVYDPSADIHNIAVYNIIGKVMAVYRVTGPSANLNLENMPSGVYFARLINSKGSVVVTKKFTKQ